jgi:CheY-like chemotaxis protein
MERTQSIAMPEQPKILLLDDDEDFLALYKEILTQHLPSGPEVKTANAAARALGMLQDEPFSLLVVDLNMPKMDGLQVLSIARRKHPHLRLMVLTALRDEQFRTRAYAMGVDQYWIKPESDQEMGLLMESIEGLLNREVNGGFRGVQSKSLVDIIQLECLSQSSCVLKINNGMVEARIWIQCGEVVDAEAPDHTGESAFKRILSWKTGNFEILPADPARTRTIFTSYQGLLLNTAQALDEEASQVVPTQPSSPEAAGSGTVTKKASLLADLSEIHGVEFALAQGTGEARSLDFWGLHNAKPVATFMQDTLRNFRQLGEQLQVGQVQQVIGSGLQRKVGFAACGNTELCVGFAPDRTPEQLRETLKSILAKWAS